MRAYKNVGDRRIKRSANKCVCANKERRVFRADGDGELWRYCVYIYGFYRGKIVYAYRQREYSAFAIVGERHDLLYLFCDRQPGIEQHIFRHIVCFGVGRSEDNTVFYYARNRERRSCY